MAMTAADPVFVDTNVLVYASVATAPLHTVALGSLQRLHAAGVQTWLSRQVLREYLAVLTRPQTFSMPLPPAALAAQINTFLALMQVAEDGPVVTKLLLALLATVPIGGRQVHDANIVATMQAYGISRLLTNNPTDFARFTPLIVVEPLVP
jgi:predicted nucleic acid-binding protein